jgi:glycosyltransferase involved in cell wall biosynthesis
MVTDAIYPYHMGGKETRTRQLSTRLAAGGTEVHVFTMNWWRGPAYRVEDGVHYHALCRAYPLYSGSRRSILEAVMFALGSFRLIAHRFDVIEADHMPHLHLFPIRVVAWLRRVPLVSTWHEYWGTAYWREYLGPLGVVAGAIEKVAMRLPDHLIAPSPETAARLVEHGVANGSVTLIPNGIDLVAIEAARAAAGGVDVLYVGRLLAHKRVELLLESIVALRTEGTTITCAIVGEGPERARLRDVVNEHQLGDQVRFLDNLDDADLFGLMKASSLFVLPSVREGFGIVVAEAMACGVPVITTCHPDNHAQALVDEGTTGWLCEATAESLSAALRRALSERGVVRPSGRVAERFDWQVSVATLVELFERSIAQRHRHASGRCPEVFPA